MSAAEVVWLIIGIAVLTFFSIVGLVMLYLLFTMAVTETSAAWREFAEDWKMRRR